MANSWTGCPFSRPPAPFDHPARDGAPPGWAGPGGAGFAFLAVTVSVAVL